MPCILVCQNKYLQLKKHQCLGTGTKLLAKYLAVHVSTMQMYDLSSTCKEIRHNEYRA